jgi:hypothetical protein
MLRSSLFREVEGLFTVLMCADCQATRRGRPASCWPTTIQASLAALGLRAVFHRAVVPQALEVPTAAEHSGWGAGTRSSGLSAPAPAGGVPAG